MKERPGSLAALDSSLSDLPRVAEPIQEISEGEDGKFDEMKASVTRHDRIRQEANYL